MADESRVVMLRCGSAHLVGGIWLVDRVLNQRLSVEDATHEAKTVDLCTDAHHKKGLAYVQLAKAA